MKKDQTLWKTYGKTALISWGILLICYAFMISNFWYGNHDWKYLKTDITLTTNLFEARYSLNLWQTLFNGHMLPILGQILALLATVITGILIGIYFEIPKGSKYYYPLALFIGLNPYIFIIFYYVYTTFSLCCWQLFAVASLLLIAPPHNVRKTILGTFAFYLIMGSYPPLLTFCFTLFCAKQILTLAAKKQTFRQSIINGSYLAIQLLIAYIGFKCTYYILLKNKIINGAMYNLDIATPSILLQNFLVELPQSITQFGHAYPFLGASYYLPLMFICLLALFILLSKKANFALIFWLIGLLIASRFTYIASANLGAAHFRIEYWGRLGIYLLSLAVVFQSPKKWIKNLTFVLLTIIFFNFTTTNYEIHKVQKFGFTADEQYQDRLKELILSHPKFDFNKDYITLHFTLPLFRHKYYHKTFTRLAQEIIDYPASILSDLTYRIFEYEKRNPIAYGKIIQPGRYNDILIVTVNNCTLQEDSNACINRDIYSTSNHPENIKNMRWWIYNEAIPGTTLNSIYIDDLYLIIANNPTDFYKNRETLLTKIDK